MGKWCKKQGEDELQVQSFDESITVYAVNNEKDDVTCYSLSYTEFMDLANWLGFEIQPRDYRKALSDL
jgi:hypothetical protein